MKAKEFNVPDFLERHQLDVSTLDFRDSCFRFLNEMIEGLGAGSSLKMIPTFIEEGGALPLGKPILVLDAGGTNFRAAIVTFSKDKGAEISEFRKRGMPGVGKKLTRKEFFDEIAGFIIDLAIKVDRIGFCFSYPMTKDPGKDGRLIKFSKEIKAPEVEDEMIGAGVVKALEDLGVDTIKKTVLLNDTVATLLAGKAAGSSDRFSGYIGLILGTGINASYSELNRNILKLDELPEGGSQIINMEAGGYMKAPHGDIDEAFFSGTSDPFTYHYEKMVSGCYLGPLSFRALLHAGKEGAFSESFSRLLEGYHGFYTADLSLLLSNRRLPEGLSEGADIQDIDRAHQICAAVAERAAFYAASGISAIVMKTGKGAVGGKSVCICADGTTFWKLHGFRERIDGLMSEYLSSESVNYEFIYIENAPVIGAAVAGLTN